MSAPKHAPKHAPEHGRSRQMVAHDARVFRIQQEILKKIEPKRAAYVGYARDLINRKLAPVDLDQALRLLEEIEIGALP